MANILIYDDKTKRALELVSAAKLIGGSIYAVSLNQEEQSEALCACGVNVLKINQPEVNSTDTAAVAMLLNQAVSHYKASIILLSSEKSSKHLAGRLAERLKAGCLADIEAITVREGAIECTRNAFGGATVAVQVIKTETQVFALAPKAFAPAGLEAGGSVTDFAVQSTPSFIRLLESKAKALDSVDISAAEALIVVGQGVEAQSALSGIEELAKKLEGEVACSKPVGTDRKWLPEARIIGISGAKCKPNVALLLGVSGQVQFYVGIRDAKTLIAVNIDENAPICSLVDYTLIANVEDVVPKLNELL